MGCRSSRSGARSAAARWGRLLAGVACVWLFMFVVAPGLRRVPGVAAALDCVREKGIDATGYFYTDVAAFGVAEAVVRESVGRR
ncbi:hypothetical protein KKG45_02180 [bacterium]|nr:hypothetical protein [bacterium]